MAWLFQSSHGRVKGFCCGDFQLSGKRGIGDEAPGVDLKKSVHESLFGAISDFDVYHDYETQK
jgi:hypothetical protein